MTSNNVCQTVSTANGNSITTAVITNLTPSVSIASNDADNSICSGTSVTFTATPTNGGTTPTYQWKLNGTNVGTNASTYTNGSLTNGAVVTVTMTSNNACQTSSFVNSNLVQIYILSGCGSILLPGNATCAAENISVSGCAGQTTLSYNGNTYDLVEIAGQCWFQDNLVSLKYNNGESIGWANPSTLATATTGSVQNGNGDWTIYGRLYNWYAVNDSRNLCPSGWHVPTDCEWMYLENSLGMSITQQQNFNGSRCCGGALRFLDLWNSPNYAATNSSQFDGLPAGLFSNQMNTTLFAASPIGLYALWWTSSFDNTTNPGMPILRRVSYNNVNLDRWRFKETTWLSVRCLKN
jgi:uncharacterized protein (TIGR02145 family)